MSGKTKKSWASVVLILLMAVTFAGCIGQEEEVQTTTIVTTEEGIEVTKTVVTTVEPEKPKELSVMTSITETQAAEIMAEAEKDLGITINLVRLSEGKGIAKIRTEAEAGKITIDCLFLYDFESFLIFKDEGYMIPYTPEGADQLLHHIVTGGYGIPVITSPQPILVNTERLAELGYDPPTKWADLADPKWKDEIVHASPVHSGTAYTTLEIFIALYGEEDGYALWADIDKNIHHYEESGTIGVTLVGTGEFAVTIPYAYTSVAAIVEGYPIKAIYPEDGTAGKVECVGILKDIDPAKLDLAKAFVDWCVGPHAMELYGSVAYLHPLMPGTTVPEAMTALDTITLVDLDREYFAAEKDRLVDKWDEQFTR